MKLTVAKKMTLLTVIALFGVSLLTGLAAYQMRQIYDGANFGNVNSVPSIVLLDDMRRNYLRTREGINRHILNTDLAKKDKLEEIVSEHRRGVLAGIRKYETNGCRGGTCAADSRDLNYLLAGKMLWAEFDRLLDPILLESRKGEAGFARARDLMNESQVAAEAIAVALNEHIAYNIEASEKAALEAAAIKDNALELALLIAVLTLLLIAASGYLITRNFKRQLGGEPDLAAEIVGRIAVGDLRSNFDLAAGDQSSMLAKIKTLNETLGLLANHAEGIGKGDLSSELVLLSEHDRLGKSINEMSRMLRASKAEDERRNWLKDGNSQLSQALTGDFSTQQLADNAIGMLGRYLGAGRGVLYVYRAEEAVLDLLGSYMYTERASPGSCIRVGEGAVGQVAREHKPIILTTLGPDAARIVTGTTSAVPLYTYTFPLLRETILLGVIELASFERFDETQIEFLTAGSALIASFLYMGEQRQSIRKLLADTERAEAEARATSERLQESNAQMEEQQQQLQQQAEELQLTNTQMEEQQQQLQQQSEELQQSNAQMEEQQLKLELQNRELLESQRLLDSKAQQVAKASQYKSEFLANMSHELRTPLNSIILLSKMMLDEEQGRVEGETFQWAQVIHRSGEDLLRLINDVLDLSKIEAGRMDLNLGVVASETLRSNFLEMFEHLARDQKVAFSVEDNLHGEFVTDADKLAQILRNLLSNAFKFTRQGGVTLTLSRRAGAALPICLAVRDTGIGIPEEKQALIFEAFQQADGSTSREYGGTGLGLTISRRFAQLLGGTIELHSVAGEGSEFSLFLPETASAPDLASAAPVRVMVQTASVPYRPTLVVNDERDGLAVGDNVILLVDDDPVLGQTLIKMNRRLGYKTLLAHTGAEGLALAHRYHPQGILLDLGLPDMDGMQVLHEIKSNSELASTPVYIVSARDRDEAFLQQGAAGFLQKPVDERQLAEAEASLLGVLSKAGGRAILVVENGGISAAEVERIVGTGGVPVLAAAPGMSVPAMLQQFDCRLVIIDLGLAPLQQVLDTAAGLKAGNPDLALVFYCLNLPSEEDELKLRRYSDGIIVKAPQAEQRLLESIERFLHEVPLTSIARESLPSQGGGSKRLSGKRILVVDDDPRNLFVFSAALERHGANVSHAVNGLRALEYLEQHGVDLVLLDIMMPQMDGYQAIAAIRGNPSLLDLPVLAVTAKASPAERERALGAGFDDYITKPVSYEMLLTLAEKWCLGRTK